MNFSVTGNMPVDKIILNMCVKGDKTNGALAFKILVDILS